MANPEMPPEPEIEPSESTPEKTGQIKNWSELSLEEKKRRYDEVIKGQKIEEETNPPEPGPISDTTAAEIKKEFEAREESVLIQKPEAEGDTTIGAGKTKINRETESAESKEEQKIDLGEPIIVGSWGAEEQKDIDIAKDTGAVAGEKKEAAVEVLDKEPAITKKQGAEIEALRQEATKEAEKKLQESGETREQFVAGREAALAQKLWVDGYNKAFEKLKEKQEKFLELRDSHKVLKENEFEDLFAAGLSLDEIKNISYSHWWSRKIKSGLSPKPVASEKFDELIKARVEEKRNELKKQAEKMLGEEWERNRQLSIIQGAVEELKAKIAEKTAQQAEAKKEQMPEKPEEPEKTEEKRKEAKTLAKIEKAEKILPEKRLELLNELRYNWRSAEKIDKSLKTGKKLKIESGEMIDPKVQQDELKGMKEYLSDEIIKTAEALTGRNLKKEALKETGYVPDKENPDEKAQKEFRKWLTKEVEKIFKEQIKIVEKATNKRVGIKKKSSTGELPKKVPLTPTQKIEPQEPEAAESEEKPEQKPEKNSAIMAELSRYQEKPDIFAIKDIRDEGWTKNYEAAKFIKITKVPPFTDIFVEVQFEDGNKRTVLAEKFLKWQQEAGESVRKQEK